MTSNIFFASQIYNKNQNESSFDKESSKIVYLDKSELFCILNSDYSISFYSSKSFTLKFCYRPSVFNKQNQLLFITELFTSFNSKHITSQFTLVLFLSDGSFHFLDNKFGVCFLSSPPNSIPDPLSIIYMKPLMETKKRYLILLRNAELYDSLKNSQENQIDYFEDFKPTEINIFDTWAMENILIQDKINDCVVSFNQVKDSINLFTKSQNLIKINLSILNANSHMKITEDIKFINQADQIKNMIEFYRTEIDLQSNLEKIIKFLNQFEKLNYPEM